MHVMHVIHSPCPFMLLPNVVQRKENMSQNFVPFPSNSPVNFSYFKPCCPIQLYRMNHQQRNHRVSSATATSFFLSSRFRATLLASYFMFINQCWTLRCLQFWRLLCLRMWRTFSPPIPNFLPNHVKHRPLLF